MVYGCKIMVLGVQWWVYSGGIVVVFNFSGGIGLYRGGIGVNSGGIGLNSGGIGLNSGGIGFKKNFK